MDGRWDWYIIDHPAGEACDLLVVFLHGGLLHADQGVCDTYDWCFGDLLDETVRRGGVYLSPEYRGNSWLNAAAEADLHRLVVQTKAEHRVSTVVVTGGSMGGTAALIYASHHPDTVNGVIALCPAVDTRALYEDMITRDELVYRHLARSIRISYGGTPSQTPREYDYRSPIKQATHLTMPVAMLHGDADPIIPVENSRSLAATLRAQGTPVLLEEIPGGDHEAPALDTPWPRYLDFVLAGG